MLAFSDRTIVNETSGTISSSGSLKLSNHNVIA